MTSLLTDTERLTTLIAGLSVLALGVYSAREGTRVGGRAFDRSAPQPARNPCVAWRCKCLQNNVFRMVRKAAPLPVEGRQHCSPGVRGYLLVPPCRPKAAAICGMRRRGYPARVRLCMTRLAMEAFRRLLQLRSEAGE